MKKTCCSCFPVLLIFITFLTYFFWIPQNETCEISDSLLSGNESSNTIKFITCSKKIILGWPQFITFSDGVISETKSASGYLLYNASGKLIKTISTNEKPLTDYNHPRIQFPDNKYILVNNNLIDFKNNNIHLINKTPKLGFNFLAYENNEIYYISSETQIMKYNLVSGEDELIISLGNLERDKLYSALYDTRVSKLTGSLTLTFNIVQRNQDAFYLLDLYNGNLTKIKDDVHRYGNSRLSYNVPDEIKYSSKNDSAKNYNLKYPANSTIDLYYLSRFKF